MADDVISKFEQRAFYSTVVGLFVLRLVEFSVSLLIPGPTVTEDGVRISYGTVPSWTMDLLSPIFCFVVFLFLVSILWKLSRKTLIVSFISLSLLTLFFDYWLVDSQMRVRQILDVNPEYPFRPLDFILMWSNVYDVVTLFLVNVLFIWNLSLFCRVISANRQSRLS